MAIDKTGLVLGAASSNVVSSTSWVTILFIAIIGGLIVCFIYKAFANKKIESSSQEAEKSAVQTTTKEAEVLKKVVPDKKDITPIVAKEEDREADESIVVPITGRLVPLSEVPDPVFAEKMMGDGFAIEPMEGKVYAPVSGKVVNLFPTKHAVAFETKAGREVLIHFGLDTVSLKGEGFRAYVEQGQEVKAGDLLLSVDLDTVMPRVPSIITPVVFSNLKPNERVVVKAHGNMEAGKQGVIVIEQDPK